MNNADNPILKVYDMTPSRNLKLKYSIPLTDPSVIGTLQIIDTIGNNLFPNGNNLFKLVEDIETPVIHYYKEVMPIKKSDGELVLFCSPKLA